MYTLTVKDGSSIFGSLHLNEKVLSITTTLRYNLKPLTVWSLFGCSRNIARVLVVSVNSRDYEFHVPEKSAESCVHTIMQQIDDIFFFDDMPQMQEVTKDE